MAHNIQYYKNLLSNANVKAFLLTIRKGEGTLVSDGYRLLCGVPVRQPRTFLSMADHPNMYYAPLDSTAAGAYQIIYKTWERTKRDLNLPDFQNSSQDIAALKLIDGRHALDDVINGKIIDAINKCNKEWASLPGSKSGQPQQSLQSAIDFYKQNGGFLAKFDEDKVKDMKAYGTGYVAQSTDSGGTASSSSSGTESNSFTQTLDFSKLAQNIDSQEQDDTTVSWGSRSSNLEESDYIGLKQYLIYLVSRYYPQSLMPFAELIPKFNTDLLNPVDGLSPEAVDALKFTGKATGLDYQNITNKIKDNLTNDKIIDADRYERTRKQLKKLNDEGGTDLFTYDPFFEFSDSFNNPNKQGKDITAKRGLSYKLYGNVVLNPAAEAEGLSKPGAIGLKGITIENGSLTQNGMTLITVKILDVQGNKLLDVNSPWSFMLNQRMDLQDFLFRYGWQVRIPKYDPNNQYKDDPQAAKFWNHIGWAGLFNARMGENNDSWDRGEALKKIIYGMSSKSDDTLTFTQNVTEKTLMNPGYSTLVGDDGKVSYRVRRDTNMFDYYSLTLINSEINVNPRDASIEATLVFKTNTAVANCLCPLNGMGLVGNFSTKSLVANKKEVTLSELMNAFVDDNYAYSSQDATKTELAKNKELYYTKKNLDDWLTVIGGIGTDSQLYINPSDIKVKISTDLKDEIINATNKDTRLLIEWLNKLLSENDMSILVAADKTSGSQLQSGFVIALDNDKANQLGGTTKTNAELAKKDITFGDFLEMVENTNRDTQTFIGSRLYVQDDVFSQRFQGSLVEEISVEKLNAPNQASIQANQNFADGVDPTSVDEGTENTDTETKAATTSTTKPGEQSKVTLADKKRNLNILYSQMLGLKVKAICHPWLKLARPCYVKGTGFWDGKYTVMKVQHELGDDGKFISIINAFRVIDSNVAEDKNRKSGINQFAAMNNPGAYKATPYTGPIPKGSAIKANAPTASLPPGVVPVNEEGKKMQADVLAATEKVQKINDSSIEGFIEHLHFSYRNHFRAFINDFQTARPEYKVVITSGYRSFAEQETLYNQDNRNARPGHSMHNYGLAIDLNVVLRATGAVVASKASSDDSWHNTGILTYAYKYGLTWGGISFGSYKDRVHFGLDGTFDTNILYYLARSQYGDNVNNIRGNYMKLTIS